MSEVNLNNQRVIIRTDLNVPVKDGVISNDARIKAFLPTLKRVQQAGAKIMIMSHFGRPTEGQFEPHYSLAPVAEYLTHTLKQPVPLISDWLQGVTFDTHDIVLLENVRFLAGEKANDKQLAQQMAALCDVFIMDAFSAGHRRHASTFGIIEYVPVSCAGPILLAELKALKMAFANPAKPVVAIVGGSKVSTKLTLLEILLTQVDQLIVGGGIANTFLVAAGYSVGNSLVETDLIPQAKNMLAQHKHKILLPIDLLFYAKLFNSGYSVTTTN